MSSDAPGLDWNELDPHHQPFDRPRCELVIASVLARHPMRHDEIALHRELARELAAIAPWLGAYRWRGLPSVAIVIERPWLALEAVAERARVAAGTANVLAAIDAWRSWLIELARVFDGVWGQLDDAASIANAVRRVLEDTDGRFGIRDIYGHVAVHWYLQHLGYPCAYDSFDDLFCDEMGYPTWPPPGGIEAALAELGNRVAAGIAE